MTRRRRPRTAQERVVGVLGTVAPGSLGGRIRNTRPATVLQPNTGGPPSGGNFDPNLEPVVIGENAAAGSGTPDDPTAGQVDAKYAVAVGSNATTSGGWYGVAVGDSSFAGDASAVAIGDSAHAVANSDVAVGHDATTTGGGDSLAVGFASRAGRQAVAAGDTAHAEGQFSVAVGSSADTGAATDAIAIGHGASTDGNGTVAIGHNARIFGDRNTAVGEWSGVDLTSASTGGTSVECTVVGYSALCHSTRSTAVGVTAEAGNPFAASDMNTAIGYNARSMHVQSTALGANATASTDHQIMLGTPSEFVEIPGDSSTAPNGLVLTDTATGTRYLVQITSGAIVLSAAP